MNASKRHIPFTIYIHPRLYNTIKTISENKGIRMSRLANLLIYKSMRELGMISEIKELERMLKEVEK